MLTAIRGARMEGYITGKTGTPDAEIDEKIADGKIVKVPNPAYEEWFARDQRVHLFLCNKGGVLSNCHFEDGGRSMERGGELVCRADTCSLN